MKNKLIHLCLFTIILYGCEYHEEVYGIVEKVDCLYDGNELICSDLKLEKNDYIYKVDSKYCTELNIGDNVVINFIDSSRFEVEYIMKIN